MEERNVNESWKKFLTIPDNGFENIYSRSFCYDEMKVLSVLEQQSAFKGFCLEEAFWLVNRCYLLWDAAYRYKHTAYIKNIRSNMLAYDIVVNNDIYQLKRKDEEGYIDAYAERVGWYLIKQYEEIMQI